MHDSVEDARTALRLYLKYRQLVEEGTFQVRQPASATRRCEVVWGTLVKSVHASICKDTGTNNWSKCSPGAAARPLHHACKQHRLVSMICAGEIGGALQLGKAIWLGASCLGCRWQACAPLCPSDDIIVIQVHCCVCDFMHASAGHPVTMEGKSVNSSQCRMEPCGCSSLSWMGLISL